MDDRDREAVEGLFAKLADVARQSGPKDRGAEALIAEKVSRQPDAAYYMAQTVVMQDMALESQGRDLAALKREVDELKRAAQTRDTSARDMEGEGSFLSRVTGGAFGRGSGAGSVASGGSGSQRPAAPWGPRPTSEPQQAANPAQPYAPQPQYPAQPYSGQQYGAPVPPQGFGSRFGGGGFGGGGGGGFLAGAAQTAMGVAGGVVLGNALGNLFEGHGFGGGAAQAAETAKDAPVEENVTINNYGSDDTGREVSQPSDPSVDNGSNANDSGFSDVSYDDTPDDGGGWSDDGSFDQV